MDGYLKKSDRKSIGGNEFAYRRKRPPKIKDGGGGCKLNILKMIENVRG